MLVVHMRALWVDSYKASGGPFFSVHKMKGTQFSIKFTRTIDQLLNDIIFALKWTTIVCLFVWCDGFNNIMKSLWMTMNEQKTRSANPQEPNLYKISMEVNISTIAFY